MRDFALQFAPLQPSNLQYCTAPSSPASPRSPFGLRPRPLFSRQDDSKRSPNSPSFDAQWAFREVVKPGPWNWKCHVCRSHYPIGATRRCLQDGHYMCPGVPEWSAKRGEYRYKHGCASDFDYRGWYIYASRREALNSERGIEQRGCSSNCFHPSECRWNSEQLAIRAKNYNECKRAAKNGDRLNGSTNLSNGLPGIPPPETSLNPLDLESKRSGPDLTTSGTDPQAPECRVDSLEPTVTFSVRAAATAEADRNPSAAHRTKRKTKRHRNIIAPLSPIKEEMLSPGPPKVDDRVCRPALRFNPHLDGVLKSDQIDDRRSKQFIQEEEEEDDVLATLDAVDDIHMPPLTRTTSRTNDRISRPVLTFTTHFLNFLEPSQRKPCVFLPELEPLDALPDFEKMDLDDPAPAPPTQQRPGTLAGPYTIGSPNSRPQNREDDSISEISGSASVEHEEDHDDDSPLSPMRTAWDWTAGGIGIALSTPGETIGTRGRGEEMGIQYHIW